MTDYILVFEIWWPLVAGVLVLLLVATYLLLGRRRRVDLARPTLEDAPPAPTLARVARAPAPAPTPAVVVPPGAPSMIVVADNGPADDLTRLKGVGPKLAALLGTLGVTRLDQIASWTEADIAAIDAHLGSFAGRAQRDRWVEQAALLAGGDRVAYEAQFGKLDGPPA